jgi:hypothetical protein
MSDSTNTPPAPTNNQPTERQQIKLQPRFPTDPLVLGAVCHQQQQAQYPVFAVTDLDDNIIFANFTEWKLTKARTNINRYWQSSTAFFQCTVELTDLAKLTPLWPAPVFRHQTTIPATSTAYTQGLSSEVKDELKKLVERFKKESQSFQNPTQGQELIDKLVKEASDDAKTAIADINTTDTSGGSIIYKLEQALDKAENSDPQQQQQQLAIDAAIAAFPLGSYDEICIYGGYLDRLRPVVSEDIKANRLLRKGVWSVDTITVSGSTPTGIIITVQCRDRLKYLMDTFGSYNTAESNELLVDKNDKPDNNNAIKRSQVILTLARRGIGEYKQQESIGGRFINSGVIYDISDAGNENTQSGNVLMDFDPYYMYNIDGGALLVSNGTVTQSNGQTSATSTNATIYNTNTPEGKAQLETALAELKAKAQAQADSEKDDADVQAKNAEIQALTPDTFMAYLDANGVKSGTNIGDINVSSAGSLRGSTANSPVAKEMVFNIVSGRVPYTTAADQYFGQNFIVADRVPLDYIRFLSQQEPWPTEVFQDSRTGEFWYAPRGLDLTGLSDKSRFFRTYYFRNWPNDLAQTTVAPSSNTQAQQAQQSEKLKELTEVRDALAQAIKDNAVTNALDQFESKYGARLDKLVGSNSNYNEALAKLDQLIKNEQQSSNTPAPASSTSTLSERADLDIRSATLVDVYKDISKALQENLNELSGFSGYINNTEEERGPYIRNLRSLSVEAANYMNVYKEEDYRIDIVKYREEVEGRDEKAVIETAERWAEELNVAIADGEKAKQELQKQEGVDELKAAQDKVIPDFGIAHPHPAQMIHTFREEVSSVSVRTNIIVQSHSPSTPDTITQILHLSVEPWFMKTRAYPCSFFTVTDDSAGTMSGDSTKRGALIALALSYARVIAKELRVSAATVLGDPSFVPGEVIQVIGSPMNPYALDPKSPYYWTEDRRQIVDMNRQYQGLANDLAVVARSNPDTPYSPPEGVDVLTNPIPGKKIVISPSGTGQTTNSDFAQAKENRNQGVNYITFKREPPSMWRVEGVVDRFMDGVPGYYTELALLSCF